MEKWWPLWNSATIRVCIAKSKVNRSHPLIPLLGVRFLRFCKGPVIRRPAHSHLQKEGMLTNYHFQPLHGPLQLQWIPSTEEVEILYSQAREQFICASWRAQRETWRNPEWAGAQHLSAIPSSLHWKVTHPPDRQETSTTRYWTCRQSRCNHCSSRSLELNNTARNLRKAFWFIRTRLLNTISKWTQDPEEHTTASPILHEGLAVALKSLGSQKTGRSATAQTCSKF